MNKPTKTSHEWYDFLEARTWINQLLGKDIDDYAGHFRATDGSRPMQEVWDELLAEMGLENLDGQVILSSHSWIDIAPIAGLVTNQKTE